MFKSTTARETSIEKKVWAGKHSTGREETDVEGKQAPRDVGRGRERRREETHQEIRGEMWTKRDIQIAIESKGMQTLLAAR